MHKTWKIVFLWLSVSDSPPRALVGLAVARKKKLKKSLGNKAATELNYFFYGPGCQSMWDLAARWHIC